MAIFPVLRGIENRGSLIGVPLALRVCDERVRGWEEKRAREEGRGRGEGEGEERGRGRGGGRGEGEREREGGEAEGRGRREEERGERPSSWGSFIFIVLVAEPSG